MRIGILTFHFGNNYGGILQCYALQQVVRSFGHDVQIINFRSQGDLTMRHIIGRLREQPSLASRFRFIRENFFTKEVMDRELQYKKYTSVAVCNTFREKYLKLSVPLDEETIGKYANARYDMIIVGSDRIWDSFYDRVPAYFMGWEPAFHGKKMSYAACSAYTKVYGKRSAELARLLNSFDKITVRDSSTAQLVKMLTGTAPQIVPDPCLLYDYSEFQEAEIVPAGPYILTYILGDEIEGGHQAALQKIKDVVGEMPVYAISIPGLEADIHPLTEKVFSTLFPEEWVAMFRHAAYVYTDSFHAVMFSLKFGIPFTAYYRNTDSNSGMLDLKERGITSIYGNVAEMQVSPEVRDSAGCLTDRFDFNQFFKGL